MFGEDFLGLRELGITSELGVSNLSVPKKLLRAKGQRMGPGNSLPYVDSVLVSFVRSLTLVPQKQTERTPATFPTTTSVRSTRVHEDGRRSYWTPTTILQVTFRCPRTTSSSLQTPNTRLVHISTYATHPRTAVATTSPLSNTSTTNYAAVYTISIISGTCPSGRYTEPGPNEDGTSRADRWWEIDECCRKEETEEGEGTDVIHNWWWQRRRRPRCREWAGRRRNERSYQYERWKRWRRPADNSGRISTRECWRDYWRDADVDHESGWNTRTGWYARRGTGGAAEEERWAREGEEGEDVRSRFEGGHCYGVVIVPLSGRVPAGIFLS